MVVDYLKKHLHDLIKDLYTSHDKVINSGCSKFRPDFLIDCLTHSVIVEIDEFGHYSYDTTCENKRTMTIFLDLGSRPIILIRINPDAYTKQNGKKHPSCFKNNKSGKLEVCSKKDLDRRLSTLVNVVRDSIQNVPTKEVTTVNLFFDEYD